MRFLVLAIVTLFAGCSQALTTPPVGAASFSEIHFVSETRGNEPRVVTGGDLVAFAPANTAASSPVVWTSSANGSFVAHDVPVALPDATGSPVLDVDILIAGQTIYVATMWNDRVEVATIATNGATHASLGSQVLAVDRPWLIPGPQSSVSMIYMQTASGEWLSTTEDQGGTFKNRLLLSTAQIGCACSGGHPTVDLGKGNLIIPFSTNGAPPALGESIAVAVADGPDWNAISLRSVPATVGLVGGPGLLSAASVPGSTVLLWNGPWKTTSGVWFARSTDGGATWSHPTPIANENETLALGWISSQTDGYVVSALAAPHAQSPGIVSGDWHPILLRLDSQMRLTARVDIPIVVHRNGLQNQLGDFISNAVTTSGSWEVGFSSDLDSPSARLASGSFGSP